jgi:hypothetical protein
MLGIAFHWNAGNDKAESSTSMSRVPAVEGIQGISQVYIFLDFLDSRVLEH